MEPLQTMHTFQRISNDSSDFLIFSSHRVGFPELIPKQDSDRARSNLDRGQPPVELFYSEILSFSSWFETSPTDQGSRGEAEAAFELPPVILLHGLLGSSTNFASWARDLKELCLEPNRRLFIVDLRNHGQSPHEDTMGYGDMASDVIHLFDTLGCQSAVLVGHSMGGKVAAATAVLAPQRVERLAVIDIAPVRYNGEDNVAWRSVELLIQTLADLPVSTLKSKKEADAQLAASVLDPEIRQFALMNLIVDKDRGCMKWRIGISAIADQLQVLSGVSLGGKSMRVYRGAVLFVKAGQSEFISDNHIPAIKSFFPTYQIETIENANHWVHVSAPDRLREIISEFVRREA